MGAFWFDAYGSLGFAVPHPSRLRRATFPPGEGFGGVSCRMGVHPCPLLAVTFTLHPSSVTAIAVPPSPEGEGFGAVELGRCRGKRTQAAGACPRPTKGTFSFPKLLSCNEPGDTQWRRSTTRITGSNCRRRHAARVTPQRCGSIARVTGSNCQRSLAALPLPLGEVPSAHTGRRGAFSLTTT